MGHRTEGLEKFARDIPEDRCFSIVFKDQRNTLDLIAPSPADVQHWVQGLRKIIHHSGSMDQRQKLQQYPPGCVGCVMVSCATVTKCQRVSSWAVCCDRWQNKSGEEGIILCFRRMESTVAGKVCSRNSRRLVTSCLQSGSTEKDENANVQFTSFLLNPRLQGMHFSPHLISFNTPSKITPRRAPQGLGGLPNTSVFLRVLAWLVLVRVLSLVSRWLFSLCPVMKREEVLLCRHQTFGQGPTFSSSSCYLPKTPIS